MSVWQYQQDEIDFIKKHYKGKSNEELTKMFNERFSDREYRNLYQIKNLKRKYNLNSGLTGRFEKGMVSHNKGKKISKEQYEKHLQHLKENPNYFKPNNSKPIGTEVVKKDNNTIYVKLANNDWKAKHILIYEQHYGKVPDGYIVIFLDQNKRNFDINNLYLISRAELMLLNSNSLLTDDAKLNQIGINIIKLHNKIKERSKQ